MLKVVAGEARQADTAAARRLVDGDISIELSPESVSKFAPDADVLPAGSKVFLTHLAGKPQERQVEAARRLIDLGYTPVVHIGARNFETEADFVSLVEAHSANGVTVGLFVGGNPLTKQGPFNEAAELLSHPVLRASSFKEAFIGGYPEGHPAISVDSLADARRRKLELCAEIGLVPSLVSQFAFDGAAMGDWASAMQREHPGIAVRLGLAGVTSLPKLIKFAVMCGVGPSIAVLRRSMGGLMNVLADKDPGDVIEGIESRYPSPAAALDLHFFPFGGWEKTLDWVRASRVKGR